LFRPTAKLIKHRTAVDFVEGPTILNDLQRLNGGWGTLRAERDA